MDGKKQKKKEKERKKIDRRKTKKLYIQSKHRHKFFLNTKLNM